MSEHLVLLVDADAALSERTRAALAPYGCRCELLRDPNDVLTTTEVPSLIVFCIDPKRLGWAISNKIKKHPLLRTVPLIITSAEATDKDFEDHKKLKFRAEEYQLKPYQVDGLVEKVRTLLGGLEVQVSGEFELPPPDDMGLEDEILVEDAEPAPPLSGADEAISTDFDDDFSDRTRVGSYVDVVAHETDAAFASLTSEPEERTMAIPIAPPPPPAMALGGSHGPPPLLTTSVPTAAAIAPPKVAVALDDEDEVLGAPRSSGAGDPALMALGHEAAHKDEVIAELRATLERERREREAHAAEAEQARAGLAERLRVVEDRHAQAARQHAAEQAEHAVAVAGSSSELGARLAAAEVALTAAQAALETREEQLADERGSARGREQAAAEERAELTARLASLEQRLAEAESSHARATDEHALVLIDKDQGHADQVAALRQRHEQAAGDLEEKHRRELLAAEGVRQEDLERLRARLQAMEEEHRDALAALAATHAESDRSAVEAARAELLDEHRGVVEKLSLAHRDELAGALAAVRRQLLDEHGQHAAALEEKHAQSLASRDALHLEGRRELETSHAEALASRDAQHLEERRALEEALGARAATLVELREQLDGELEAARKLERDLGELREQLAHKDEKIAALEHDNAAFQEQILRAYHRLRTDESTIARARKALTIAVSLLDDGFAPTSSAAKGPKSE